MREGEGSGTKIVSRIKVEGIHRWKSCPIEEVSYLRDYHRHVFYISCYKEVCHDDRDIEFIQLSHQVFNFLKEEYYSTAHSCLFFGDSSCEMIAEQIARKFDLCECEVNEDNEGGAIFRLR